MMRIGHGFDVHRFADVAEHGTIRLGGIDVPSDYPLLAHSDGDVVLHALCDALLGAISAGDIGEHFPDTDARWKGADSRDLLAQVYQDVTQKGYRLANCDITVVAQTPRLKDHKDAMKTQIAADLGTDPFNVNVKATTTEKLGYVGRKEGIAVHAVCLLMSVSG